MVPFCFSYDLPIASGSLCSRWGGNSMKRHKGDIPLVVPGRWGGGLSTNIHRREHSHPARGPPFCVTSRKRCTTYFPFAKDQRVNTDVYIPRVGRSLGLTPVPAAIMTTLRWAGGGISLSCRKGPCSCTAGFSTFWRGNRYSDSRIQVHAEVIKNSKC